MVGWGGGDHLPLVDQAASGAGHAANITPCHIHGALPPSPGGSSDRRLQTTPGRLGAEKTCILVITPLAKELSLVAERPDSSQHLS